jgi:hypothetical protein
LWAALRFTVYHNPRVDINLIMAVAQCRQPVSNPVCVLQRDDDLKVLPDIAVRSTASKASRPQALIKQRVRLRG